MTEKLFLKRVAGVYSLLPPFFLKKIIEGRIFQTLRNCCLTFDEVEREIRTRLSWKRGSRWGIFYQRNSRRRWWWWTIILMITMTHEPNDSYLMYPPSSPISHRHVHTIFLFSINFFFLSLPPSLSSAVLLVSLPPVLSDIMVFCNIV